MKTTLSISILFIFGLVLLTINACKKDSASSTPDTNQSIVEAQSCLISKINSDSIQYNPDSSIQSYGYVLFKRFGDTLYSQIFGLPYGYIVYDQLNRPKLIKFPGDTCSKKILKYVGNTNKISSVELFGYSKDSLNHQQLSYYYKLVFTYLGNKIINANYEFLNREKDIELNKGVFQYNYLTKYTDSRMLTIQKLLVPILYRSNPIQEISQYSIYPVSTVKDSQNKFSSSFTYEFDSKGKITKETVREYFDILSENTYSYSCN